uniref:Ribosomal protein S2 n=1 Tax=Tryblionella apiculata TaxID=1003145 RepID=A0A8F1B811_9STRA|nr:ribosomal protein S2 [Tryblionella apiculata]QWM93599.1 ribosomal protein S2 [Tryblionella apiculata]
MKTKKFKFKQILKLHLLKSRAYENSIKKSNSLSHISLTQTIVDFKKILKIIFKYHQIGKRILFVGVPTELELKINKLTNHVAVSKTFNLQGFISNNIKTNKNSKSRFSSFLLPKLVQKPDLIVLFSSEKEQNIISESYVAKTPLIKFGADCSVTNSEVASLYTVSGFGDNLQLNQNKNLIFIGLNFLFKTINRKNRKSDKLMNKPLRSEFQTKRKQFK